MEEYSLLEVLLTGSGAFREDPDAFVVAGLDTCPQVASKRALYVGGSPPGYVWDILGPVCEWTSTHSGSYRVDRGGSWYASPAYARVAYRGWGGPGSRYRYLGFRLARDL